MRTPLIALPKSASSDLAWVARVSKGQKRGRFGGGVVKKSIKSFFSQISEERKTGVFLILLMEGEGGDVF